MDTTIVKIDEFKNLISTAPNVLAENQESKSKAIEVGKSLIEEAKQGMNDVIDSKLANYIEKVKKTKKAMNDKRSPFTQMMTIISKEFTSLENSLDEPLNEAQCIRNEYATKIMQERQEAEKQAQLKLAKEQEAIEIERLFRIGYASASEDYILDFKKSKLEWFNGLTLETIEAAENEICNFDNNLRDSQFCFQVTLPLSVKYHSVEEKVDITGKITQGLCYSSMGDFKRSMGDFKQELLDLLPSKKNQLLEIERLRLEAIEIQKAEAERQRKAEEDAAEAKRLLDLEQDLEKKAKMEEEARVAALKAEEQRQLAESEELERKRKLEEAEELERQRQESARIKAEEESNQKKQEAEAEAAVQAAGQSVNAMVDSQVDLFTEAPKVKESYNIEVLNSGGYLQLVAFWFENEGKNLPCEKIESMTFGRIKTFCEKYAIKNDTIIDSKLLFYKPIYKAK